MNEIGMDDAVVWEYETNTRKTGCANQVTTCRVLGV